MSANPAVTITRCVNSCVLFEFGEERVLADPWFTERWYIHHGETPGFQLEDLPPLTAIIVSHFFVNHWDRRALAKYARRHETPLYVATRRMEHQGRKLGFERAKHVTWGDRQRLAPNLELEVVEDTKNAGQRLNNYVLTSDRVRVFFGGEASQLGPIARYGQEAPPVDVALLPVNGLKVIGGPRMVTGPKDAIDGARAVGAEVFVPIHDAHYADPAWFMVRRHGSASDAARYAGMRGGPQVVDIRSGIPWDYVPTPQPVAR